MYKTIPLILEEELREKLKKLEIKSSFSAMQHIKFSNLSNLLSIQEIKKISEQNPNIENELKAIYNQWHENVRYFPELKQLLALSNGLINEEHYNLAEISLVTNNKKVGYAYFFKISPNKYYQITFPNKNNRCPDGEKVPPRDLCVTEVL